MLTLRVERLLALAEVGIERVVINTSYLGAMFRDVLADGRHYGLRIRYSDEGEQPLDVEGAAGARRRPPRAGPGRQRDMGQRQHVAAGLSEILLERLGNPHLDAVFPGYTGYEPLGVIAGSSLPSAVFSDGFESGDLNAWSVTT